MLRFAAGPGHPELPYLLYAPRDADGDGRLPLVVFLHGSGERGEDLATVARYGLPRYLDAGRTLPACVLVPQCPAGREWTDVLDRLEATVERVGREHPAACDRILLTGFSMGSFGAWEWALRRPSRIGALAPVAGSRPPGAEHDLRTLRGLPIWMVHGAADVHVPVDGADALAAELEDRGVRFRYTRYPDADHGETCRRAYGEQGLCDWLLSQPMPAAPPA